LFHSKLKLLLTFDYKGNIKAHVFFSSTLPSCHWKLTLSHLTAFCFVLQRGPLRQRGAVDGEAAEGVPLPLRGLQGALRFSIQAEQG